MQDRREALERHAYTRAQDLYSDEIKELLEEIYAPEDVAEISNMDNARSYEYLIALDNRGFFSQRVDLGGGISMETMDQAIEERDLHYLYVQVSTVKPFLLRSIWRYRKGGQELDVLEDGLADAFPCAFARLSLLAERYGLVTVREADLSLRTTEDGQACSFYQKYFDWEADA